MSVPERELWVDGEDFLVNVHPRELCQGRHCVLHNPSDHHMREWKLIFRNDTGLMERICEHEIGHPDPDSLYYFQEVLGREDAVVHGCDRCCWEPIEEKQQE